MRIVLACRSYPTIKPGGMPFVCQDRAEQLAKEGHDVHILLPGPQKIFEHKGVTLHFVGGDFRLYSKDYASGCASACISLSPDIVHLDSADLRSKWWIDRPGKARAYAITLHGMAIGAMLTRWNLWRLGLKDIDDFRLNLKSLKHEPELLRTFDTVIGISRCELWHLQDIYGLPNAKLVYNPIAACFFAPQVPYNPNGDIVAAEVFENDARGISAISSWCKVVRDRAREDMVDLYDRCRCLVVPTYYAKGYDLTVAEAAARGRPVVVYGVGSYLMESWENDWIHTVPLGDVLRLHAAAHGTLGIPSKSAADKHRPENHVKAWLEALT